VAAELSGLDPEEYKRAIESERRLLQQLEEEEAYRLQGEMGLWPLGDQREAGEAHYVTYSEQRDDGTFEQPARWSPRRSLQHEQASQHAVDAEYQQAREQELSASYR